MLERIAKTKDPRTRYYVTPTRVLWQTEGEGVEVLSAEALLEERDGQATLGGGEACILSNRGGQAGLLLDFGTELQGGVQIALWTAGTGAKTTKLRVRFGESAAEAMSERGPSSTATNDHAVRDTIVEVSSFLGATDIGNTGFRFVRIDLLDPEESIRIKSVRAFLLIRELERPGSFRCSDPLLTRIWEVGAYTVHLNMQEYLWDGVKRDRLVWVGDMHPETSTIQAVFGNHEVVPLSLDFSRDETPLPGWMNGFPSYSMWWILIHRDWYRQSGDMDYLLEQKSYLLGLLAALIGHVRDDGTHDAPSAFLDWPTSPNRAGVEAGVHALFVLALQAGAELCGLLGAAEAERDCRRAERTLRRRVPEHGGSKQAAALMALSGLVDPVEANERVLAVDGPRGISTFLGYYVLKARGEAGDFVGALDVIRRYWGGMLELGATTFWEDFDLSWMENASRIDELPVPGKVDVHGSYGDYCYKGYRHSLCHGWASGPTAWLSEYVLGVRIVEPGCRKLAIRPRLGDLEWAEGSFPTPFGPVRVAHRRRADGAVETEIDAPVGVEIEYA
ncbi:alpha-L-rhamnosidase [Paenibacillus antri]|uniref:Alpha-L-rhamnosidase n=1 Tax=Paenibacillus antri TaxID=2582848 RepID=A0A5R9GHS9_9BACL|nr:alpha-L-rhamnosidase C-terminal domain-containing protein [Paenibacillus antri]TLS52353.1 alpha-L-rhamnosidase [Paenibacillus antri]